jgi:hypothetical protein
MLEEIEDAIREVRERKNILLQLREIVDDGDDDYSVPDMIPMLSVPVYEPGGLSVSSRVTRSRFQPFGEDECTFKPAISAKSRRMASKRAREPLHIKSGTPKSVTVTTPAVPQVSAVTEAIANRIKKTYGSLDEYHRQRRENTLLYKDFHNKRETEELRECTFQPTISQPPGIENSQNLTVEISGLEGFLNRLQKAREMKLAEEDDAHKPGSGYLYDGRPTKIQPFSFLDRQAAARAQIRD